MGSMTPVGVMVQSGISMIGGAMSQRPILTKGLSVFLISILVTIGQDRLRRPPRPPDPPPETTDHPSSSAPLALRNGLIQYPCGLETLYLGLIRP